MSDGNVSEWRVGELQWARNLSGRTSIPLKLSFDGRLSVVIRSFERRGLGRGRGRSRDAMNDCHVFVVGPLGVFSSDSYFRILSRGRVIFRTLVLRSPSTFHE